MGSHFTDHVLDLLADWRPAVARRMFDGVGLFVSGRMFAIIFAETLYLKEPLDHEGKPASLGFDKEYFEYERQGKTVRLGYYKVPERALDEGAFLIELAEKSLRSASTRRKSPSRG